MLMILSFGASHVPGIGGLEIEITTLSPQQVTHLPPVWDLLFPLA